jgi:hypothetical protein
MNPRDRDIIRWRNQVKADRRLHAVDFTVAFQLTERTNRAEFEKSGRLVTWQGAGTMAAAIASARPCEAG